MPIKKRQVACDGVVYQSLIECCEHFKISYRLVCKRLTNDWTLEEAVEIHPWPGKREMMRRHRLSKEFGKTSCPHRDAVAEIENSTGMFLCSGCSVQKRNSELSKCETRKICKSCRSDKSRRKNFKLSSEAYAAMLANQNGLCAICGKAPEFVEGRDPMCVDHCHKTGKIRGLLCNNCNFGIGKFMDSSIFIEQAIQYIEESNANQ